MTRLLPGFKVRIHPLFWLVAAAAAATGQFIELLSLFFLVIIHELGHVFAARAVGWRITSMEILPFGGVAKVDEWGTTEIRDEIFVALAGPFMNIAMIGTAFFFSWTGIWQPEWRDFFIQGNLLIAGFNLLPIWPLDGGKVLHAVLSGIIPFRRSIYYTICFSSAVLSALIGFSFLLPSRMNLIAVCVYLLIENFMALRRIHYLFIRFLLARHRQNQMKSKHGALPVVTFYLHPGEKIGDVVKMLKKGSYHCFEICDEKRNKVASLREEQLLSAYFEKNPRYPVSELIPIG